MHLIHELKEDNPDRRLQCLEELIVRCGVNQNFRTLFSNEANFF